MIATYHIVQIVSISHQTELFKMGCARSQYDLESEARGVAVNKARVPNVQCSLVSIITESWCFHWSDDEQHAQFLQILVVCSSEIWCCLFPTMITLNMICIICDFDSSVPDFYHFISNLNSASAHASWSGLLLHKRPAAFCSIFSYEQQCWCEFVNNFSWGRKWNTGANRLKSLYHYNSTDTPSRTYEPSCELD